MSGTVEDEVAGRGRPKKSPSAFRTISEVADDLHIPQHVLRFWEAKFPQVKPLKRGGGRRYYRPDDITLLRRVADLLYIQGYTIRGVQRLLREGGGKLGENLPPPDPKDAAEAGAETGEGGPPPIEEKQLAMPGFAGETAAPARGRAQARAPAERPAERKDRVASDLPPEGGAELHRVVREVLDELEALRALLA